MEPNSKHEHGVKYFLTYLPLFILWGSFAIHKNLSGIIFHVLLPFLTKFIYQSSVWWNPRRTNNPHISCSLQKFSTGCCSNNSNLLSWFSSKPNNLSRLSCIQKQQVVVTIKPGLVLCVLHIFYQAPKEGIGDDWQKAPVRSSWLLEVSPIKTIPYFIGESQHLIAFLHLHFQSRKGDIKIPCSF